MSVDEAPKKVAEGKIKSVKDKLTMYSLYKQIQEGDCDMSKEKEMTREKFGAWQQQKGKSKFSCK